MRWKLVALVIGPCLCNTGCSMYESIARNAVKVPVIVSDEHLVEKRSKQQARTAWREVVAKSGEEQFSCAYRDGFIEGYSDYLVHGGKGEPPPVPPWRYLLIHDQNPEGREKQEQWFAGFRHGAALAIRSGLREYITVPLSTVWPADPYRRTYPARPRRTAPGEPELLPQPREELPEVLPVPRVMPEEPKAGGPELFPKPGTAAALPGPTVPELLPVGFSPEGTVSATGGRSSEPSRGLLTRWVAPRVPSAADVETVPVLSRQP